MSMVHNGLFLYPKQVIFKVKTAISDGFRILFSGHIPENTNFSGEMNVLSNL